MSDVNKLKTWIDNAEEDFSAAKALFRLKKPLLSGACFHAQQCAEKYTGILTGLVLQDLVDLTEYAVRRRYPGNQPTPEEASEAIETAKIVRRFARSYLGLKK